jgi:hypothetical protein
MEAITREIERALDAELYYLAVAVSLSLPDVCAGLQSQSGQTGPSKYRKWYDEWLAPQYPSLTAHDAYGLRCGVLHQGRMGNPKMQQFSRVIFAVDPSAGIFHRNVIKDALQLDATVFCRDVLNAVSRWYAAKKNDPNVQANLPRLVQLREKGISPYLVGIRVIA